mmetsp:Transcript_34991/g.102566  ORF Transcript_34991/g.102566 Transcript_34991/m.102566 type:complete len:203 (-) Transcript_34991:161-769(-)
MLRRRGHVRHVGVYSLLCHVHRHRRARDAQPHRGGRARLLRRRVSHPAPLAAADCPVLVALVDVRPRGVQLHPVAQAAQSPRGPAAADGNAPRERRRPEVGAHRRRQADGADAQDGGAGSQRADGVPRGARGGGQGRVRRGRRRAARDARGDRGGEAVFAALPGRLQEDGPAQDRLVLLQGRPHLGRLAHAANDAQAQIRQA